MKCCAAARRFVKHGFRRFAMPFGGITKRLITVVMIESVLSALLLGFR